jgi:NADH dehydrogenase [ubiquinone] 1 alpha subcomplex assembly factor 7
MSQKLRDIIVSHIRQFGPMDLGEYMSLCLGHPQHGYYVTRDPFGVKGDFTTAPEISQMFGEMIGAWVVDTWDKLGRPNPFALVECGPGRGTLMQDLLRATKNVPGFHDALHLHLLEISPTLKAAQAERLSAYNPVWLDTLDGLPEMPIILIGNEFIDALPIRQVKFDEEWLEVVIGADEDGKFHAGVKPADASLISQLPGRILERQSDKVFEISPITNAYLMNLSSHIKKRGGVAIFIDYGHAVSECGDTLQALRDHRFESPFENPGQADITAHVDFENVGRISSAMGLHAFSIVTQGAFLRSLGIEIRAEVLKRRATEVQAAEIDVALARLTHENQMGELFKVIALCHDPKIELAGF